jgi:hypothetical protein
VPVSTGWARTATWINRAIQKTGILFNQVAGYGKFENSLLAVCAGGKILAEKQNKKVLFVIATQ